MFVAEGGGLIVLVLNGEIRYHKLQVVFFKKKSTRIYPRLHLYFLNIWYHQVPPTCSAKKREAKDGPLVICKKDGYRWLGGLLNLDVE